MAEHKQSQQIQDIKQPSNILGFFPGKKRIFDALLKSQKSHLQNKALKSNIGTTSVVQAESKTSGCLNPKWFPLKKNTPPKFNSEFTPEKWWLEDDPASYWVSVAFQGRTVKLRGGGRQNNTAQNKTYNSNEP